jgi:hypothetical protein
MAEGWSKTLDERGESHQPSAICPDLKRTVNPPVIFKKLQSAPI